MPFQLSHSCDQNIKSDLQPSSSVTVSCIFSTVLERCLKMKERPWGMILIAKLKCPSIERISLFVRVVNREYDLIKPQILSSLSSGRDACILTESSVIPRKSRTREGPFVFSSARGIPNLLNALTRRFMLRDGLASGKSMSKKSSNRWRTNCSLHLNVSLTEKEYLFCQLTPKRCHWDGCKGMILNASVISALLSHAPLPANLMSLIALSTVE